MISFYFDNQAFDCQSSENSIIMIVAAKEIYRTPYIFLTEAINFLDEKVDPSNNFKNEYENASLKEGQYLDIVKKWIATMSNKIEIQVNNILKTYRIKKATYDPYCDEFILETKTEYILFLWSTSA